jgi:hypothetical protein
MNPDYIAERADAKKISHLGFTKLGKSQGRTGSHSHSKYKLFKKLEVQQESSRPPEWELFSGPATHSHSHFTHFIFSKVTRNKRTNPKIMATTKDKLYSTANRF